MSDSFLRIGLLALTLLSLTGCESIPMPTGASKPTNEQIWGSGDGGEEKEAKETEEEETSQEEEEEGSE